MDIFDQDKFTVNSFRGQSLTSIKSLYLSDEEVLLKPFVIDDNLRIVGIGRRRVCGGIALPPVSAFG